MRATSNVVCIPLARNWSIASDRLWIVVPLICKINNLEMWWWGWIKNQLQLFRERVKNKYLADCNRTAPYVATLCVALVPGREIYNCQHNFTWRIWSPGRTRPSRSAILPDSICNIEYTKNMQIFTSTHYRHTHPHIYQLTSLTKMSVSCSSPVP